MELGSTSLTFLTLLIDILHRHKVAKVTLKTNMKGPNS